jgi:uncharacterized protein
MSGQEGPAGGGREDLSRAGRYLALPLIWLVRAYQLLISPLTPPSCRFYPCCSSYAITALRRFGPLKGSWLTVRRLLRCNPWNPGGVDHVPQRRRPTAPAPEVGSPGRAGDTARRMHRPHRVVPGP